MFGRVVWRAMLERRQRVGLALAALTVTAALGTALLTFYADIDNKLHGQFAGYGPNLILSPAPGAETLPLGALSEARKYGLAAPYLNSVQTVNGQQVVVSGVDFESLEPLTAYWQVNGSRRPVAGECLAGETVAGRLSLRPGSILEVAGVRHRVAGVVASGGPEDIQILLPLEEVALLTGRAGQASLITVRARTASVEAVRRALSAALPGIEVRILRAIAESESNVVLKIRGTLYLLTVLVLIIAALCVMNNFNAIVYHRRKEIGILKAIGGSERRIGALLASEAVAVAASGSLLGFLAGYWLARWLSMQIFHQPAGMHMRVLLPVFAVTVLAALLAIRLPLRRLHRIEPAVILRGE